jgi:hypothetical protein
MSPGDDIKVSASTYVAYKRCPAQAGARLQGVYGPDSRPAFVGSLAHRLFSRHLRAGPIAPGDFEQACREEIGSSTLNNKVGALGLKPSSLSAVIDEARVLYERFIRFPQEGFEGAEHSIESSPSEGVTLVGTVDAVFVDGAGHRLVDWKTGELGEPEDQLLFYALLWLLLSDELPVSVEAVSVKTGERYATVPSSGDVQRVAADLGELVDTIRASWASGDELARVGGPWCRHCPILDDCDEGKSAEALLG